MTERRYRPRTGTPRVRVDCTVAVPTRDLLDESGAPSATAGQVLDDWAARRLKKRERETKEGT